MQKLRLKMQRMSSLLGQNRRSRRCFSGAGWQVELFNLFPLRNKWATRDKIAKNKFNFFLSTLRKKPLSRDEIAQKFHKLAKNSRRISLWKNTAPRVLERSCRFWLEFNIYVIFNELKISKITIEFFSFLLTPDASWP